MTYIPRKRPPRPWSFHLLGEGAWLLGGFLALVGSLKLLFVVNDYVRKDSLDREALGGSYLAVLLLNVLLPLGLWLGGGILFGIGAYRAWRQRKETSSDAPQPRGGSARIGTALRLLGDGVGMLALLQVLRGSFGTYLVMQAWSAPSGGFVRADYLLEGYRDQLVNFVLLPVFLGVLSLILIGAGWYLSRPPRQPTLRDHPEA